MQTNIRPKWLLFDLLLKRNHDKAAEVLDNIEAYNPLDPQLDVARASLCIEQRDYADAIKLLNSAINDFPANSDLKDLAIVAETSTGKFSNFDKYLDKVNTLRGESRYVNYRKYFFNINCHPHWSAERVYEYHSQWYDHISREINIEKYKFNNYNFDRSKRLRIGYISGDFKLHSCLIFFYASVMHQKRENVELVAYSNVNPNHITEETEVFKTYFDKWRDIHTMPDSGVMQQIKKDEIDILIDLSGHTTDNRPHVIMSASCTNTSHRSIWIWADNWYSRN